MTPRRLLTKKSEEELKEIEEELKERVYVGVEKEMRYYIFKEVVISGKTKNEIINMYKMYKEMKENV